MFSSPSHAHMQIMFQTLSSDAPLYKHLQNSSFGCRGNFHQPSTERKASKLNDHNLSIESAHKRLSILEQRQSHTHACITTWAKPHALVS